MMVTFGTDKIGQATLVFSRVIVKIEREYLYV
jgi:hypothetical protein